LKYRPIKKEIQYNNYIDYLKNLEKELKERRGSDWFYPFDCIIDLFELNLSNPENTIKMN
jgi:hypothetical protein